MQQRCSDELGVVDPGTQGRPELAEGGCIVHVLPAEAMDTGERKL